MSLSPRKPALQYVALAAITVIIGGGAGVIWAQLTDGERASLFSILNERASLILTSAFLFILAAVVVTQWIIRRYIEPLRKLVEDVKLMNVANSTRRLAAQGTSELRELASAINQSADVIQSLKVDVDRRVQESQKDIEREKHILSTLVDEFASGVVVCNMEGVILLHNKKARELLERADPEGNSLTSAGLGRSIFGVVDRNLISHGLDRIGLRSRDRNPNERVHFVTTGSGKKILRAEMVPLRMSDGETSSLNLSGFVLLVSDVSQQVEQDSLRGIFLEETFSRIRSFVATIRASAEVLMDFPKLEDEQRARFITAVRDESLGLSSHIDKAVEKHITEFSSAWPMEETPCSEVLVALKRLAEQTLDVSLTLDERNRDTTAMLDSYMLLHAMLFILDETKKAGGVMTFTCAVATRDQFANIDLCWKGKAFPAATLRDWEGRRLRVEGHEIPLTLNEVLRRHNAEIWSQATDESHACIRIVLPSAAITLAKPGWQVPASPGGRPEFYDFDLFQTGAQQPMGSRHLVELAYTAFDCETTGLQPSAGDEIISIGAVRIVNGRLLQQEIFDQLIDPRRPISPGSFRVHGIGEAILKGQPLITDVLPRFHRFTEGTVLVGHNAAFDMKFFRMKQASTGIRIENPVLDTLLLSAVVHPNQEDHNLEAIAERLGVSIVGRHTALGDALLTGEVFLKLVSLLVDNGITTLAEALEASRQTYYSRLKY